MEQKYIRVADGELVYNNVGTLNEHNIDEANAELADMATDCRRESEYYIDKDVLNTKIMSFLAIAVGVIVTIISIVWTITLDWGFFALIIMSALLLLFGLFALLYIIYKQKSNKRIRDNGALYFAQPVKAPTPIFTAKLKCACIIDGKACMLKYRTSPATFAALQKKEYIIIAYDKMTNKFLPVRLFSNTDEELVK